MTDTIESGNDSQGASTRSRRGVLALVAALALVLGMASGASLAGSGYDATDQLALSAPGSATPTPAAGSGASASDGFRGRGHAFGHGFGRGPMVSALALHGSFVVPDGDGGYRTVVSQRGVVTAVSGTSLTLKSKDGFVATYRLTDATHVLGGTGGVRDIAQGDDVGIAADRRGWVNTATHVVALDHMGGHGRSLRAT